MPDSLNWLSRLLGGGDPEARGAAQASTAMQPQVLDYAQRVLSGQIAREGVLGQPRPYDPGLSYRQNVPDTRASLEPAIDVAMGIGPGAIRAFHGSPFDFSRFSLGKIGSGEGAQAYGHGLYFAEAEDVARGYRERLAGFPVQSLIGPGGETLATGRPVQFADKIHLSDAMPADMPFLGNSIKRLWTEGREIDVPSVIKEAWGGLELPESVKPKITAAVESAIERAKPVLSQYRIETTRPGHMYEVDINADPQRLLDWDKPLGAQPAELQQAMSRVLGPGSHAQDRGRTLYDMISNAYDKRFFTGGRAEASQALADAGIPGIRYLDQGSRGAGQGTSNYVVFDDKLIDILRKYGIAGPVAGGGLLAAGSEPPT